MDSQLLGQVLVNGVVASLIYILIALGLALVFGIMKILNFAHGAMYMLGGYGIYVLFQLSGLNYFISAIISIILVGALGVIIERVFIRPVRVELIIVFIITLALSMMFETGTGRAFGTEHLAISTPFPGVARPLGVTISWQRVAVVFISAILVIGLFFFLNRTKAGQAMRAVGQDIEAAALQGIDPGRTASLCMFIGCALAAAAATLTAPIFTVHPYMGGAPLMKGFTIMIIGGVGSIPGCVVGGFILGFIDSTTATFLGADIASMVGFALLMLILLVRPRGILGHE